MVSIIIIIYLTHQLYSYYIIIIIIIYIIIILIIIIFLIIIFPFLNLDATSSFLIILDRFSLSGCTHFISILLAFLFLSINYSGMLGGFF